MSNFTLFMIRPAIALWVLSFILSLVGCAGGGEGEEYTDYTEAQANIVVKPDHTPALVPTKEKT